MKVVQKLHFLLLAGLLGSCLPEGENRESPFGEQSTSQVSVFDAVATVAMTGFIDPSEYESLFTQTSPALALQDQGSGEGGAVQTETGVQAFVYGLEIKTNGEYTRTPLGTANVNNNGFFEFDVPEQSTIFVSIGTPYGERKRMLFTAPAAAEVTQKEESVLIRQTDAMDYATTTIFKKLEDYPEFTEMVSTGINTAAIHMAGAIYEQALIDGSLDEWSATDLDIYAEKLVEKMAAMNTAFAAAGKDPAAIFAEADLRAFNYNTIETTINAQQELDLAHRSTVAEVIVSTEVADLGNSEIVANVAADAVAEADLDNMDNPISIGRAATETRLRAQARINFSGDQLKAVLSALPLKMRKYSTLALIKTDVIPFSAGDAASNDLKALYNSATSQDYEGALQAVFTGLDDDDKASFKASYTGVTTVDPDRYDQDMLEILKQKCELWGGIVADLPVDNDGNAGLAFMDGSAKFYCKYASSSLCSAAVSAHGTLVAGTFGYNFYGVANPSIGGVSSETFCKIYDLRTGNESAERWTDEQRKAMRYDPTSHFLNANGCMLMGGYVPALATSDADYNQTCYFHIPAP